MVGKRNGDRSNLSTKPKNVRARVRRHNRDMSEDIELLLPKPVEEWDLEELARGRCRKPDGKWPGGGKSKWLTPVIAQEVKRRFLEKSLEELSMNMGPALEAIKHLISSSDLDEDGYPIVDPRLRFDAAKFVIEQVLGKAKQKLDIEAGQALQTMLAGILVNPDGSVAHPIIEGEVWDGEAEDPE